MRNSFGRKAEFFILTSVVIVGVFYGLSKYINPYSFIDTSQVFGGGEIFFFNNVKEKAIKTVEISGSDELTDNLNEYEDFVEEIAAEKGYNLVFDHRIRTDSVDINMTLTSQKYVLKSSFSVPRP